MRLPAKLFLFSLLPLFYGCSVKEVVVYKDVIIPVKCDVSIPEAPELKGELLSDLSAVLEHSELLEHALKTCTQSSIN